MKSALVNGGVYQAAGETYVYHDDQGVPVVSCRRRGYYNFHDAAEGRHHANVLMTGRDNTGKVVTRVFLLGRLAFTSEQRVA